MSKQPRPHLALFLIIAIAAAACGNPATAVPPTQPPPTAAPTVAPTVPAPASPTPAAPISPLPTPASGESPLAPQTGTSQAVDPAQMLADILAAPGDHMGQQVTVAGELLAEGNMPSVRFYLADGSGRRLEVIPWLPLEVAQPAQGGEAPESMANYAGRQVTLTGVLGGGEQGPSLLVSSATLR